MEIKLSYNDLELLMTPEDRQQIKDMPEPSLEQAKLVIERWNDFFGDRICLKPYIKARDSYPELFV